MTEQARTQSVVVGIDGSQAALDAATWAVAEAVSRGVTLRLVHVSPATHACRPPAEERPWDVERAETALYRAEMAINDTGKPVQVETAIRRGRPDCVLIDESREASLVCVGVSIVVQTGQRTLAARLSVASRYRLVHLSCTMRRP